MRNKKVLTLVLKVLKHVSCLISRGSELKSLGAATANALSPSVFLVLPLYGRFFYHKKLLNEIIIIIVYFSVMSLQPPLIIYFLKIFRYQESTQILLCKTLKNKQ